MYNKDDIKEIKQLLKEINDKLENPKNYTLKMSEKKRIFYEIYRSNEKVNISSISNNLKVSRRTLYNWIKELNNYDRINEV